MDFACSIQRSNVLLTGEGTSYRIPDRLINSRFRCQGFGCKFFNPRIVSKSRSTRNIRRSIAGGCLDSSLVSIGTFETNLWVSYSNKSLFRSVDGVFKVPRGVILQCQDNDSVAYINGNGRNVEFDSGDESSRVEFADGADSNGLGGDEIEVKEDAEAPSLDELKELLVKAMKELEVAQVNSTMFEEKAQRISENAIALKDEASNAWKDVSATLDMVQEIVNEECLAKETVQKATMVLSLAEARLQVAIESLQVAKEENDSSEGSRVNDTESGDREEDGVLLAAETEIRECQANLANCEAELKRLQSKKEELQKEVDRLNEAAEKAEMNALKAEEEVANIMLLAEQAVAFELEVAQRVNDAEIALQRAEKSVSISRVDISGRNKGYVSGDEATVEEEKMVKTDDASTERERDLAINGDYLISESLPDILSDGTSQILEYQSDEMSDENGKLGVDSPVEAEMEIEKSKNIMQVKKQESQKDLTRESSPLNAPKALLKKSSRFFSASFFSFAVDGTEFTPASVFQGLMESVRKKLPKLVLGFLLIGAGYVLLLNFFVSLYLLSFECLCSMYCVTSHFIFHNFLLYHLLMLLDCDILCSQSCLLC